ncbi:hypothetical protein Dvina_45060 [Dactylosporangium vinaceum]|uniref:Uncharacterized protein n=1 Tax=Dactylosporangium vinaceum TaxID=53362 RepID=A0ABV5MIQ6_9ACTN|nr:hypothetical protein [Dactylosporangium vinaceum]UAB95146.1 hypothetical protein Dvina_45060 [Dactylosporangium vinaceum]
MADLDDFLPYGLGPSIHIADTYDGGRLCPDVTTKHPGGHHPECCCSTCDPYDDDWPVGQP